MPWFRFTKKTATKSVPENNKDQLVDRILSQRTPGEKVIVYTVSGTDAKIDNEVEVPKYNHLDKE